MQKLHNETTAEQSNEVKMYNPLTGANISTRTILNPQKHGDKKGFADNDGNWVIPPTYDDVDVFREGVCWVKTGDKWGLINEDGKTLIEPRYDDIREFNEGYGNVKIAGKWGVVNKRGNCIFPPQFDLIGQYQSGIAKVKTNGKYGFVNVKSMFALPPIYDDADGFSEGYAAICVNGRWGYVDETGKVVIQLKFKEAGKFQNGRARVVTLDFKPGVVYKNGKFVKNLGLYFDLDSSRDTKAVYGCIDRTGNSVVNPKYEVFRDFVNGFADVKIDDKWGMINTSGAYVCEPYYNDPIRPEFSKSEDYHEEEDDFSHLANSKYETIVEDGKIGIIDNCQKHIIEPMYKDVIWNTVENVFTVKAEIPKSINQKREQCSGLHSARIAEESENPTCFKWGVIDSEGNTIVEPIFETQGDTLEFSEGFAPVCINDKWGYINAEGKLIIQPIFDEACQFSESLAPISINDKWGYIDMDGNCVIKPLFDNAYPFYEGFAKVRMNDKWGLINTSGQFVLEPFFQDIAGAAMDDYRLVIEENGKWGIVSRDGRLLFDTSDYIIWSIDEGMAKIACAKNNNNSKNESGWGFIDCDTWQIIAPRFDTAGVFHEGFAVVGSWL